MVGLNLPAPRHQEVEEEEVDAAPAPSRNVGPPPQGKRQGFIPRSLGDFGDGGAFPEIHVAQYPHDMGRKGKQSGQVLALTTDSTGKARHDLIATVGQREGKTVHSSKTAITPKQLGDDELAKPGEEAEAENTERTRLALDAMVSGKAANAHGSLAKALSDKKEPTYIRYTPSNQGAAQASGATNRVIRMVEAPVDPMEPPKFKHNRTPPPSLPPPPYPRSPNLDARPPLSSLTSLTILTLAPYPHKFSAHSFSHSP